jgi:protein-S-isoprenylcysteine O-methyltransferase Ste14
MALDHYVVLAVIFEVFSFFHLYTFLKPVSRDNFKNLIIRSTVSGILLIFLFMYLFKTADETLLLFPQMKSSLISIPALIGLYISNRAILDVMKKGILREFYGLGSKKVLMVSGIYARTRHPMYFGWLLASYSLILALPRGLVLEFIVLVHIYVIILSKAEEKIMEHLFGEHYLEYKKKTPFMVPRMRM